MKVYRVEDSSGGGPYHSHATRVELHHEKHNKNPWRTRPGPREDFGFRPDECYRYGFESTEQLKKWFVRKDRRLLAERKFVIREYKVPKRHVVIGKYQVAFNFYKATPTKTYDVEEMK